MMISVWLASSLAGAPGSTNMPGSYRPGSRAAG
jgi:hypothetical protein